MQGNTFPFGKVILATFTVTLLVTSTWASEKVIHNFGSGTDGRTPQSSLVFDAAGNLYGTTYAGGSEGLGTVFKISPNGSGGWTTTVLHNFRGAPDGANPYAGLVMDGAGNLYGTTHAGGNSSTDCSAGCGTVFESSPNGSGGWTTTVIHNFNGSNGELPYAGLILDGSGNLYGATYAGGSHGFGVVYEMSPNGSGGWTTTVLHNLGNGDDGQNPKAGLVLDGAGNLYGITTGGGSLHFGVVFEMKPNGSGGWTEEVIHSFGEGDDGFIPQNGSLILDGSGNLYGTCSVGGSHMAGTAFEMSPDGSGGWTEKVIHNFGSGSDGQDPFAGLIFDGSGTLYGTTVAGGGDDDGTVFMMTPNGSGGWTESVLHNFGQGLDGSTPAGAGLVLDGSGNLYGTTSAGGSHDQGTVFEVTP
jgi:uncharacterized repeat protein (TIGR03803 family)